MKHRQARQPKPMDVTDHPENVMPDRMSTVNPITAPPDPGRALQGPQDPSNAVF